MKKLKIILLSSILYNTGFAFDIDKKIEQEAMKTQVKKFDKKTNIKNQKQSKNLIFTNKKALKKFLIKKQKKALYYIYNGKREELLNLINEINSITSISKEQKISFVSYIFWRFVNYYSINSSLNNFYPFDKNKLIKEKEFIFKLINSVDFEYNKESKELYFALHFIMLDKKGLNTEFSEFINKSYPYGIDDKTFFLKYFILLNSKFIEYNSNYLSIYSPLFENFQNYYKNINGKITDNILILYIYSLKKLNLDLQKDFIKNALLDQISKNPFNSDLYYFLALYYKPDDLIKSMREKDDYFDKYIKNLEKSIQYNVFNTEAWKEYVNALIITKQYEKALKFIDFSIKNNTEPTNIKKMTYFKGYIYYLVGLKEKDIKKLQYSLKLFKEINNYDYIETIKKYIKIFSQ